MFWKNLSEGVGYKYRINGNITESIFHSRLKIAYIEIRQFSS